MSLLWSLKAILRSALQSFLPSIPWLDHGGSRGLVFHDPLPRSIPSVTTDDVDRIIRRDFGESRVAEVQAILDDYGVTDWQHEVARVHLAILKFASGDLSRLRVRTEEACRDYRDVLNVENPRYWNLAYSGSNDRTAEEEAARDDWAEYQTWLGRKMQPVDDNAPPTNDGEQAVPPNGPQAFQFQFIFLSITPVGALNRSGKNYEDPNPNLPPQAASKVCQGFHV